VSKQISHSTSEAVEIADGPHTGQIHLVRAGTTELRLPRFARLTPDYFAESVYRRSGETRRGRVRFKVVK
jgi:hypothetical protein